MDHRIADIDLALDALDAESDALDDEDARCAIAFERVEACDLPACAQPFADLVRSGEFLAEVADDGVVRYWRLHAAGRPSTELLAVTFETHGE